MIHSIPRSSAQTRRSRSFAARESLAALAVACGLAAVGPGVARAAAWAPHRVIVGYRHAVSAAGRRLGLPGQPVATGSVDAVVKRLGPDRPVTAALRSLRARPDVAYAYPDYVARAAGAFFPDDPGRTHKRRGWERAQWNMLPLPGVDAPEAWFNLLADGRAGGKGVRVAVLDTGVAYRDWGQFKISPDFRGTRFAAPRDFVAANRLPVDRDGHGTFVAGEIAERTNNDFGLTGLAYGATIMPVRVLNQDAAGSESMIAAGIRYAVAHHARVINLSLEFPLGRVRRAGQIPLIVKAVDDARRHGVVVVAAAGNEGGGTVAEPARLPGVISVGATTKDGCAASYSDMGAALDLVAPGGGDDALLASDPDCHPSRLLPPIFQLTLSDPPFGKVPGDFARFGYPGYYTGTSMAAAEVSATAALVIASRVLGPRPSPAAVLKRLEQTATPLPAGATPPDRHYGWGLVNAGAATAPGQPSGD